MVAIDHATASRDRDQGTEYNPCTQYGWWNMFNGQIGKQNTERRIKH